MMGMDPSAVMQPRAQPVARAGNLRGGLPIFPQGATSGRAPSSSSNMRPGTLDLVAHCGNGEGLWTTSKCWGRFHLRPEPPFTGVSRPSGPKITKKSQKRSFRGSGEKSQKISENVTKKTKKVRKYAVLDFFGYFGGLFCRPPKRPLRLFWDFFALLGLEGPETPVNGGSGRKVSEHCYGNGFLQLEVWHEIAFCRREVYDKVGCEDPSEVLTLASLIEPMHREVWQRGCTGDRACIASAWPVTPHFPAWWHVVGQLETWHFSQNPVQAVAGSKAGSGWYKIERNPTFQLTSKKRP